MNKSELADVCDICKEKTEGDLYPFIGDEYLRCYDCAVWEEWG